MRWKERREKFRGILAGKDCVNPASVFDAVSARIAEDAGYEMGMLAGSVASLAVIGAPDLIAITLDECAEQAYRICRAGNLSLMVDADHGYGNALNVMRTVEELERAGAAGLSIEDTLLPPAHGSARKPQLVSIAEGVGKMKAALSARRDPALVIAGRTSVNFTTDEDAVARLTAYEKAGVDAIFVVGVKNHAQFAKIAGALSLPIILGAAPPDMADKVKLASLGVRVALTGHQPFQAAVKAVHDTMHALRSGTPPKDLKGLASADLMKQVTRDADYERWIDAFLGGT